MREYRTKNGSRRYAADVTCYDQNGYEVRLRKSGFTTKSAAVSWEETTPILVARGEYQRCNSTFDKVQRLTTRGVYDLCVKHWVETQELKQSTIYNYGWSLASLPFLDKAWTAVTQSDVDALRQHRTALMVVRKMLLTCEHLHYPTPKVVVNPLKTKPKAPRFLSPDEFAALAAELEPYWRNLAILLVTTGMRIGEALALQFSDVDYKRQRLTIRRTATRLSGHHVQTPKSGKERTIPLSPVAADAIRALTAERFSPPWVVVGPGGQPLQYKGIHRFFKRASERAGLEGFVIHQLRHTAATWSLGAGASLEAIRELLGHSTMEMSLRYAHVTSDVVEDLVDKLGCVTLASTQKILSQ